MRLHSLLVVLAAIGLALARTGWIPAARAASLLQAPDSLAVGGKGNVFVDDPTGVTKFSPAGAVLAQWAAYSLAKGLSFMPPMLSSMAAARDGSLFACDVTDNRVLHISTAGKTIASWKEADCEALAVDRHGRLYMAGAGNGATESVWAFTTAGHLLWHRPTPINGVIRMAMAPSGNMYFSGKSNGKHVVFGTDAHGKPLTVWNRTTNAAGHFVWPAGVAADKYGNVYIIDSKANAVTKVSAAGVIRERVPLRGPLGTPFDVGVDRAGNVYVLSDEALGKLSRSGHLLLTVR